MSICTTNPLRQTADLPLCPTLDEDVQHAEPLLAFNDPVTMTTGAVAVNAGRVLWAMAPLPVKIGVAVLGAVGGLYALKQYIGEGQSAGNPSRKAEASPKILEGEIRPANLPRQPLHAAPLRDAARQPQAIPSERRADEHFQPMASAGKRSGNPAGENPANSNKLDTTDKAEKDAAKGLKKRAPKPPPASTGTLAEVVEQVSPPKASIQAKVNLAKVIKAMQEETGSLEYYRDPQRNHTLVTRYGLESLREVASKCDAATEKVKETREHLSPDDLVDPVFAGQAFRLLKTAEQLKQIAETRIKLLEDAASSKDDVSDEIAGLQALDAVLLSTVPQPNGREGWVPEADQPYCAAVITHCLRALRSLGSRGDLSADQAERLGNAARQTLERAQDAYWQSKQ